MQAAAAHPEGAARGADRQSVNQFTTIAPEMKSGLAEFVIKKGSSLPAGAQLLHGFRRIFPPRAVSQGPGHANASV